MSQPKWKTVFNTDYSRLQVDTTHVYEPELEIADEIGEGKYQLFRFPIDRLKLVRDEKDKNKMYLVSHKYDRSYPHPLASYEEWFAEDLNRVASSAGVSLDSLIQDLISADVRRRAAAYENIGRYHGFLNFDEQPRILTESQLNKRWR